MAKFSGFTNKTAERMLLDAGAFFKNYNVDTDTFETAVAAGKLLGATRGGGQFSSIPEVRNIEVDGVRGKAKGLQSIDSWEVKITANLLEISREALADALGASEVDSITNEDYDIITAKTQIELSDFIDNITYVGKLSGSDNPVIIQVYNVMNKNGLTLQPQDKNESVIALEFEGHFDAETLEEVPFKIYYPRTN
ncbi:hypothetical protein BhaS171_00015 [Bacillus phage vB_BhaS-171]|uniref:major tail protein n=1 Tax=Bacillus phage vB_BhaS-171 TaxID=1775140 RepID=UPI000744D207|nr:major tail protein [Bacillus phage vB_BhaS-171]ALY08071.1 hypothetical protein BhaS171_00015 [Bacillus phage vB_BhaS-171]